MREKIDLNRPEARIVRGKRGATNSNSVAGARSDPIRSMRVEGRRKREMAALPYPIQLVLEGFLFDLVEELRRNRLGPRQDLLHRRKIDPGDEMPGRFSPVQATASRSGKKPMREGLLRPIILLRLQPQGVPIEDTNITPVA